MNQAFKTKLLATLFVPALALASGASFAMGDTNKTTGQYGTTDSSSKITGQSATNGSTSTNAAGTGMTSGKSTSAADTFARLDTNHDGKLSASEAAADPKVQALWKKLDTNNDGMVSQAEFTAHQAELK
jgi:hypothetical protein